MATQIDFPTLNDHTVKREFRRAYRIRRGSLTRRSTVIVGPQKGKPRCQEWTISERGLEGSQCCAVGKVARDGVRFGKGDVRDGVRYCRRHDPEKVARAALQRMVDGQVLWPRWK